MASRFTFHVLLTLLLLFGQLSSLLHAMEHLQAPERMALHLTSCEVNHDHSHSSGKHLHSFATLESHCAEADEEWSACAVFHFHGNLQINVPATFAGLSAESNTIETDSLVSSLKSERFFSRYEIRGPPTDT